MWLDNRYSLTELARLSGLERRTIRHYIQQGLLLGPESGGRYACYSRGHLDRLLAIRFLKEARGESIADVRLKLMSMGEDEVRSLAEASAKAVNPALAAGSSSALEYLRSLGASRREAASSGGQASALTTPLDRLLLELEGLTKGRNVPRRARGKGWFLIEITPDLVLSVRGVRREDHLARFERLADHLRFLLQGGAADE